MPHRRRLTSQRPSPCTVTLPPFSHAHCRTAPACCRYRRRNANKRQRVIAPHVYPRSITRADPATMTPAALTARYDLSWGNKAVGTDQLAGYVSAWRPFGGF